MPYVTGNFGVLVAILVLAIATLVVLSVYSVYRRSRKKRSDVQLGFAPVAKSDPDFREWIVSFYNRAGPNYALDHIFRKSGRDYVLYRYDVYTNTGRVYNTLAVLSPRINLARFSISAGMNADTSIEVVNTAWVERLFSFAQQSLVDFSQYPEFASRYIVSGQNQVAVRNSLSPHVIAWLDQIRDAPGMSLVQIGGEGGVLTWAYGDMQSPNAIGEKEGLRVSQERLLKLFELFRANSGAMNM